MDIVIHSLGMPFNGETLKSKSLGGSETAAYYQARELAARGHRVVVFTNDEEGGESDGVLYCWAGPITQETPLGRNFEFYASKTPHDVLILQRAPMAFHRQWASKINILQLHDLSLYRQAGIVQFGLWNIDRVTAVSQWHKAQVEKVWGIDPEFVSVVPNGVDAALYAGGEDLSQLIVSRSTDGTHGRDGIDVTVPNGAFVMLYQSRPERGLEHLLRPGGIMDRLRDTDAHLLFCTYDNKPAHMQGFYDQLAEWAKALPNVTDLGSLTKAQLAQLQQSCDLLIYPSEFEETSCVTAMEAMHAGLPLLASKTGALVETTKDGGTRLLDLKDGVADEDAFVERVKFYADQDNADVLNTLKQQQLAAALRWTWTAAVDELERVIDDCFERRRPSDARLARHAIEFSDIELLDFAESDNPIVERAKVERDTLFAFRQGADEYAAHYAHHQTEFYDKFEEAVIGEDVTHTPRFRGVAGLVSQEVTRSGSRGIRLLDFGCAHGHFIMPLAKVFPHCEFVGIDGSGRAIAAARKWIERDGLTNVELRIGFEDALEVQPGRVIGMDGTTGQMQVEPAPDDTFDVIIAAEVVEHVRDYHALLEALRAKLRPNGLLIVTTPAGRWEWTGTEAFRSGREHMHHFERADIKDICGDNPVDISYAPHHSQDRTGSTLGSWIWSVRPDAPFQRRDMARKMRVLAPRETVSLCMIVCNAEKTLRSAVESAIDWVDELVLAIDPKTKDRTRDVIEQLQGDYQWKPITVVDGLDPLKDGFAAARNVTVEKASGDWILWMDADERIQQPWNLWKYLRPSHIKAIGFPQVHYSTNPEQVLTTDYPCRLFRNHRGVKFYGLVHEHPELEMGKAIPNATIKHDVKFLHDGYIDEEVRRKRFQRNLPLLIQDLKDNPQRSLNSFLWLRDIAQGLMFEQEQTGGQPLPGHAERAAEGVSVFENLLNSDQHLRMVIDALPYYTHCVQTLGGGFEAVVDFHIVHPQAPDLGCKTKVSTKFINREHFFKLMTRITEEATRHYEDRYL